jgi:uncharacterized protein
MSGPRGRDRDSDGRPRNARTRDELGRPIDRRDGTAAQDEPALPPAEALRRAQSLLDDGRPFTAHEVLEGVWKASEGDERMLWRALAQLAVGITHAQRGNPTGAVSLLERAAANLAAYDHQMPTAEAPYGVDVAGLAQWIAETVTDIGRYKHPPRLTLGFRQTVS